MPRKTRKTPESELLWHSKMREWREHRLETDPRFTQEGVAELLDTSHANISRWENGKQRPKPDRIQEIANLLTWGDTTILLKYAPGTEQERLFEMFRRILATRQTPPTERPIVTKTVKRKTTKRKAPKPPEEPSED